MKKIISLLTCILLILTLSVSASAYYDYANGLRTRLIVDEADIIDDAAEEILLGKYEEISDTYACEIAVLTVNETNESDISRFADNYYDNNGYGYGEAHDGMLLVIDMGSREYAITTYGTALTIFNDHNLAVLEDKFVSYLSDGSYVSAFSAFADESGYILNSYSMSDIYSDGSYIADDDFYFSDDSDYIFYEDEYYYESDSFSPFSLKIILVSVGIGLLIALIYTGILRKQLKTVESKASAKDYVIPGSLQLTQQRDVFMFKNVSRRAKPQKTSSSGGSSSSGSHGGSSGKF